MSSRAERDGDIEVWRRWQEKERGAATLDAPDPLLIAAYAEGNLDEAEAEPVEAWLLLHPEALEDVIAARTADQSAPVSEAAILRAQALVTAPAAGVVAFRQPPRRAPFWRVAAAWGGIAASVAATGMVGFLLGSTAYSSIVASADDSDDMLDPPTGFFLSLLDDRNT